LPLPLGGDDTWPPPDCHLNLEDARAWAAWWSGDTAELMSTSGTDESGRLPDVKQPERRFNLGIWQRQADMRDSQTAVRYLHAPLASGIAETSADLLFGEVPDLTLPETTTKRVSRRPTRAGTLCRPDWRSWSRTPACGPGS
jgi:hypothetical protein